MESVAVIGLILGIGGILVGNIIEGGHIGSLIQFAALVIVLSGTFGAVLLSSRKQDAVLGLKMFMDAFKKPDHTQGNKQLAFMVELATLARKETILSIEPHISRIDDVFTQNILKAVVDKINSGTIRDIFEQQISLEEENLLNGAKFWSDAGGFAPTIGIIGAILGLIHVMSNLADPSKLGAGIAVAFVATVYGVGFANLVFIPVGSKLKKRIHEMIRQRQMILEGGLAILAELPPALVEIKMKSFLEEP